MHLTKQISKQLHGGPSKIRLDRRYDVRMMSAANELGHESESEMRARRRWPAALLPLMIVASQIALAQAPIASLGSPPGAPLDSGVVQIANLLKVDSELQRLAALRAQRSVDAAPTIDELTLRQQILESVQVCTLQVDSVVAEIANEQSEISSLRTILQSRRDRKANRLTTAALLVGSGLGTAASATQFTSLGNTTQNVGDAIAVGSGAGTIVLSILAARAQNGPKGKVDNTPNMLAPLFGGRAVLRTYYPPFVLEYLQSVPPGEDPSRGTRLEQLMKDWDGAGRLALSDSAQRRSKIEALVSSGDPNLRVSIGDLTDRLAMLGDVRSRVSLIKRDLASLVLFVHGSSQ